MESTYERVRDLIVSGAYPAGQRVTEYELSERLDVSRTPVREALSKLESDGLVRSGRRGTTVAQLGSKGLRDAHLVRANLEGLTAALAAGRQLAGEISPAALSRLVQYADLADRATRGGDLAAGIDHNRTFHRHIAVLADNPLALAMLDRVWDQIIVSTRTSLTAPSRPAQVDGEHRQLIAAITAGLAEAAADNARGHAMATLSAQPDQSEGAS